MSRNRVRDLAYAKDRGYAMRKLLAEAKVRVGCAICGYKEHAAALDFNHFKGEKRADITKMITYSRVSISTEVLKCVVLCSNCHRIYTTDPNALSEIYWKHHGE